MARRDDLEKLQGRIQELTAKKVHFAEELALAENSREHLYQCPAFEVAIMQLTHEIENVSREVRDKMDSMF